MCQHEGSLNDPTRDLQLPASLPDHQSPPLASQSRPLCTITNIHLLTYSCVSTVEARETCNHMLPNLLSFCVLADLETALRWKRMVRPVWSQPCHGVNVASIDHWQNPTFDTHIAVSSAKRFTEFTNASKLLA